VTWKLDGSNFFTHRATYLPCASNMYVVLVRGMTDTYIKRRVLHTLAQETGESFGSISGRVPRVKVSSRMRLLLRLSHRSTYCVSLSYS
jgi:hypothetical protein